MLAAFALSAITPMSLGVFTSTPGAQTLSFDMTIRNVGNSECGMEHDAQPPRKIFELDDIPVYDSNEVIVGGCVKGRPYCQATGGSKVFLQTPGTAGDDFDLTSGLDASFETEYNIIDGTFPALNVEVIHFLAKTNLTGRVNLATSPDVYRIGPNLASSVIVTNTGGDAKAVLSDGMGGQQDLDGNEVFECGGTRRIQAGAAVGGQLTANIDVTYIKHSEGIY